MSTRHLARHFHAVTGESPLRRHFHAQLGVPPDAYRRTFRS